MVRPKEGDPEQNNNNLQWLIQDLPEHGRQPVIWQNFQKAGGGDIQNFAM